MDRVPDAFNCVSLASAVQKHPCSPACDRGKDRWSEVPHRRGERRISPSSVGDIPCPRPNGEPSTCRKVGMGLFAFLKLG